MQLVLIASLIGFLLVSLVLGFIAGKKTKTLSDFISGNKRWSTGAIVMTYIATTMGGGSFLRDSYEAYKYGFFVTLAFSGANIAMYFRGKLFAKAFSHFSDCSSLGDVLYKLYGAGINIFASFLSVIFCLCVAGLQIKLLATVISTFIDLSPEISILASGLIIVLYTSMGGIIAVIKTDILQFIILFGALLIMASFSITKAGGLCAVLANSDGIKSISDNLQSFESWQFYIGTFLAGLLFSYDLVFPYNVQRVLLNQGGLQLSRSMKYAGIWYFLGNFIIGLISICTISLFPFAKSGIEILSYVSNKVVPSAFKPVIFIGLVALIFSTGDSVIHTGGVILAKDLLPKLRIQASLKNARLSVLILGILATFLAIKGAVVFSKLEYIHAIIVPCLSVPLFLAFCGYKSSTKAFWLASICASLVYFLVKLTIPSISGFAILFALLTNLCIFFASKFIEEGEFFKSFVTTPHTKPIHTSRLMNFLKGGASLDDAPYVPFGVFFTVVFNINSFYTVAPHLEERVFFIRAIGTFITCLLITKSIWPLWLKKHIGVYWFIALTYCLPFVSSIMFLISGGDQIFSMSLAGSLLLLLILVEWPIALLMTFIGCVASVICHTKVLGVSICLNNVPFAALQITFSVVVGLLFAQRKQIFARNYRSMVDFWRTIHRSSVTSAQESVRILQEINDSFAHDKLNPLDEIKKLMHELSANNTKAAEQSASKLQEYLIANDRTVLPYCVLHAKKASLKNLLEDITNMAQSMNLDSFSVVLDSKETNLTCDEIGIKKFVWKALDEYIASKNSIYAEDYYLTLVVSDTKILYTPENRVMPGICLTIVEDENLKPTLVKDQYNIQHINPTHIPTVSTKDMEQEDIKNIVLAHYGLLIKSKDGFMHQIIVPVDLYGIRPKNLDQLAPTDYHYNWPEAAELEKKLLTEVKEKLPKVSLPMVEKALAVIKKYHAPQTRKSGEPYYMHPMQVTLKLISMILDDKITVHKLLVEEQENIVLATMMHDVLEDTSLTQVALRNIFSNKVVDYILEVTKIDYTERARILDNEAAFAKLMEQQPIAVCIKIADRLHNLETVEGHADVDKRKKIALETLKFFIKPAEKYNMLAARDEMQRICDRVLEAKS